MTKASGFDELAVLAEMVFRKSAGDGTMRNTITDFGTGKPLRIAYVLGGLPFGGIERWLLDVCINYKKSGLVTPRVFNISGLGFLMPNYEAAGIDVCNIGTSNRATSSHRLDIAVKLRCRLREFAPDIIHTMHFSANHLGRIAALHLGIPVIMHLHNTKREHSLTRRLSDTLLSYATTRYLCVSKAVAEVAQMDHNRARRPVDVLYNAINPAMLEDVPLDIKGIFGVSGPYIVSVGRYVPQKNLDLLVRAMAILRAKSIQASLLLVGEGAERIRAPLEALRDELGLADSVVFTGFRSDVAAFFKAAHVFAMPSAYEGFGIAHLEAMYCGLPAVLSPYVPSLEIASEACLVCDTTPEDIAAKLCSLLADEALRRRLGESARRIAQSMTMEKYVVKLYHYYRAVLGKSAFPEHSAFS